MYIKDYLLNPKKFHSHEIYCTNHLFSNEKSITENSSYDIFKNPLYIRPKSLRKSEGGLRTKGSYKKTYTEKPLITVITVVLNASEQIGKTIESIINQTYSNIEYIVIDGGSADGTINIIRSYETQIDYWVSESDNGIFDAMNKAIIVSAGSYISFMNAGDTYYSHKTIEKIVHLLNRNDELVYGDYFSSKKGMIKQPSKISKFFLYCGTICHQSMFISRKLFQVVGLYEAKHTIGGDPDWLLRAFFKNIQFRYLEIPICVYAGGGVSDNVENQFEKKSRLRKSYFSSSERLVFLILDILISSYRRIIAFDFSTPYIIKRVLYKIKSIYN